MRPSAVTLILAASVIGCSGAGANNPRAHAGVANATYRVPLMLEIQNKLDSTCDLERVGIVLDNLPVAEPEALPNRELSLRLALRAVSPGNHVVGVRALAHCQPFQKAPWYAGINVEHGVRVEDGAGVLRVTLTQEGGNGDEDTPMQAHVAFDLARDDDEPLKLATDRDLADWLR